MNSTVQTLEHPSCVASVYWKLARSTAEPPAALQTDTKNTEYTRLFHFLPCSLPEAYKLSWLSTNNCFSLYAQRFAGLYCFTQMGNIPIYNKKCFTQIHPQPLLTSCLTPNFVSRSNKTSIPWSLTYALCLVETAPFSRKSKGKIWIIAFFLTSQRTSQTWWYTPLILALERLLRQVDLCEFEACLVYTAVVLMCPSFTQLFMLWGHPTSHYKIISLQLCNCNLVSGIAMWISGL